MDPWVCLRGWRSWIRPLVIGLYIIALVIALPLLIVAFQLKDTATHTQAWFIGAFFICLAIPISIWGILQHLIHYNQPQLQRHIVRILWMVPIYAANAWLALRFPPSAIYLDTMRECYEAYVIYNFMVYLLNYLRSEHADLEGDLAVKDQVGHLIPFCCLPKWRMGSMFIERCRHGVMQYVVIRPITTILSLICAWAGVYGEGEINFKTAWIYLVFINNLSQIWAMYCLILFYQGTKEELAPIKPIAKFMCVKAVVFMSFWQGVLISILVQVKVIQGSDTWPFYSDTDVATGLQDFCICIEMFFAAVAHYFSFSHIPFIDPGADTAECCQSFVSMWDVSDVRDDVVHHVRTVGSTVKGTVTRPLRTRRDNERTPLLKGTEDNNTQDNGNSSLAHTPPVHVSIDDVFKSGATHRDDAPPCAEGPLISIAEDSSSIHTVDSAVSDFRNPSSFTASMNNYAQFTESGDLRGPSVASSLSTDLVNSQQDVAPSDQTLHVSPQKVSKKSKKKAKRKSSTHEDGSKSVKTKEINEDALAEKPGPSDHHTSDTEKDPAC